MSILQISILILTIDIILEVIFYITKQNIKNNKNKNKKRKNGVYFPSIDIDKRIYISGKMTGLTKDKILKKFSLSETELREKGYSVLNPSVMFYLQDTKGFSNESWLHIDYAMIDICDAIYMQKDWKSSKGARKELAYALEWHKEVIYEDETTIENIKEN